jgi:hypothetical protein
MMHAREGRSQSLGTRAPGKRVGGAALSPLVPLLIGGAGRATLDFPRSRPSVSYL